MKALKVENLTKKYSNGLVALKSITLEVDEGDFFALIGQNGAGKSTTIGIISSLIKKSGGIIKVFNNDIEVDFAKAKSLIGVVPQEMNFSLFEKISQILINQAGYYGIPAKIAKVRMEFYLQEMGLWHMHNQAAFRLSGGMKRRLMIARAMMTEPRLLILDEPTAGVDIELRHTLWKFLKNLNEAGTTIILTTHYFEEAEHLCKNVAIIDKGQIVEKENMQTLISRVNVHTIIFDLAKPLSSAIDLAPFHYQLINNMTLEIEMRQGHTLNDLFNLLNKNQILVKTMRNKANRLEESYMYLINKDKKH